MAVGIDDGPPADDERQSDEVDDDRVALQKQEIPQLHHHRQRHAPRKQGHEPPSRIDGRLNIILAA